MARAKQVIRVMVAPRHPPITDTLPAPLVTALRERVARLYPQMRLMSIEPLAPDSEGSTGATEKASGYGRPVRLHLEGADGSLDVVFRVATANEFGHDRRSDRAANTLLAYDDFARIPRHIEAHDIGAVCRDGTLVPLSADCELYLLTSFAPGTLYADDLRRIARNGVATDEDMARVDALASYLARLHVHVDNPHAYRRAIRDLVGHGEGVFGIIDGYPRECPAASPERLAAIERRCVAWRWILHERHDRLARTHGDFHPFNIVFDGPSFTLLDASRGTVGDPADDLTALAVNFVLFALEHPASWRDGFSRLWRQLWSTYFSERSDPELLTVAPPFFAWRALVVCNPKFYPGLSERARDALLAFASRALDSRRLDIGAPDELFR